jgi:hypothetical protein
MHEQDRRRMHTGFLMGKPEGIRSIGRPTLRWEENIKMNL